MTDKQQRILDTSIELFLQKGYYGTTTREISQIAEVSEGLIFKHFKNKEGLLNYSMNYIDTSVTESLNLNTDDSNPKTLIKLVLQAPFILNEEQLKHWCLIFKLQHEFNDSQFNSLQNLQQQTTQAFDELQYKHPELESDILLNTMRLCIEKCYKNDNTSKGLLLRFLENKYHL